MLPHHHGEVEARLTLPDYHRVVTHRAEARLTFEGRLHGEPFRLEVRPAAREVRFVEHDDIPAGEEV